MPGDMFLMTYLLVNNTTLSDDDFVRFLTIHLLDTLTSTCTLCYNDVSAVTIKSIIQLFDIFTRTNKVINLSYHICAIRKKTKQKLTKFIFLSYCVITKLDFYMQKSYHYEVTDGDSRFYDQINRQSIGQSPLVPKPFHFCYILILTLKISGLNIIMTS